MSILIFSRPVRSGKTTELKAWCGLQRSIGGILMPDSNGCRKMTDIRSGEEFDAQYTDTGLPAGELQTIGRFHFYNRAFEKANAVLLDEMKQEPDWLVVDEAGKLEMGGKGFYPALKELVPLYLENKVNGTLLLVIRDSLLDELISFLEIKRSRVISAISETDL